MQHNCKGQELLQPHLDIKALQIRQNFQPCPSWCPAPQGALPICSSIASFVFFCSEDFVCTLLWHKLTTSINKCVFVAGPLTGSIYSVMYSEEVLPQSCCEKVAKQMTCEFDAQHDHASHPEEEDVMASLQQSPRVELG